MNKANQKGDKMNTDQETTSLGCINEVIKNILSYLDAGSRKDAVPMLNINKHFGNLDMEKEKKSDIAHFKRLAHKVLHKKEMLSNESEWAEFELRVSRILKSI